MDMVHKSTKEYNKACATECAFLNEVVDDDDAGSTPGRNLLPPPIVLKIKTIFIVPLSQGPDDLLPNNDIVK